jgi:hypothetical protein
MTDFRTGTIIRTKYNEIGIVLDRVPFGYYLWAKDFSDTGFHPLYDTLNGAIELEITDTRNPKEIKEILNKYK